MSENDIRGLMGALPAPEDDAQSIVYRLVEMALVDLNRIAEAQEIIAKTLSAIADRMPGPYRP